MRGGPSIVVAVFALIVGVACFALLANAEHSAATHARRSIEESLEGTKYIYVDIFGGMEGRRGRGPLVCLSIPNSTV